LSGDKASCQRAKEAIQSLVSDGFSAITHPSWVKQSVDVAFDSLSLVIGPRGQTIKSIQGDTGARIVRSATVLVTSICVS
jgi:hypothetical protein